MAMTKEQLARRVKDVAYLEGDFVLRSGKRSKYYLDKYLFETQPDILAELGRLFAKHAADADQIAGARIGVTIRTAPHRLAPWTRAASSNS